MKYLKNLRSSECFDGIKPWEFTKYEMVPKNCLADKVARDTWINDPTLDFYVYSMNEGVQANLRIRAENPVHSGDGFAADVDSAITFEEIQEFTKGMRYRPNWFEQTLSDRGRLIWLYASNLKYPSSGFFTATMIEFADKLELEMLPGFDRPSFLTSGRYFTNGCRWSQMAKAPITDDSVRATVMKVSEKFDWTAKEFGKPVSLESVAQECVRRYPRFSGWTSEFKIGSTGPSFWIEESESPKSAIIRETGIHTFSAHATKAFYSWEELVGKEFVEVTEEKKHGKATEDLFYDGTMYWFKSLKGEFKPSDQAKTELYLRNSCGITSKKNKNEELTELQKIIAFVDRNQRVDVAGPCAFFPKGRMTYNGKDFLNTHSIDALKPAPDATPWGPTGKFPFISEFLDQFFTSKEQLEIFLAWHKRFYLMCLNRKPVSGQAILAFGPPDSGKTLCGTRIVGDSVGGSSDGNQLFTEAGGFNGSLFDYGLICVSDVVMATTDSGLRHMSEKIKAFVANPEHQYNEKFLVAHRMPWQGRIYFDGNDDAQSLRSAPSLDMSNEDKLILLQVGDRRIEFFEADEMKEKIKLELPHFLRWLCDWQPPEHCFNRASTRFGVRSFCHPTLRASIQKSSTLNSLGELLTKFLDEYFGDNRDSSEWSGTATDLRIHMCANPAFAELLRSYRPEQMTRLLLQMNSTKSLPMEIVDSESQHRIYKFPRRTPPATKKSGPNLTNNSQFEQP